MSGFLEALRSGPIVADGGMGSMVHQSAQGPVTSVDAVNLTEPDVVLAIHLRFIAAGARLIETNSFGANRVKLSRYGLQDRLAEINGRAVKLAREAREISGRDVFIGGSIGPTGIVSKGRPEDPERIQAFFEEQARALDDRGVDLFVLETFASIWELQQAIAAVRRVSALPIVATITLPAEDDWTDPNAWLLRDTWQRLKRVAELEADVVGTNCTLGPDKLLTAVQRIAQRPLGGRVLAAQPNSGLPRMEQGRFIFPRSTPEYFGWFAREAARLGVRLVGGCCGTGPEHVAAMVEAVKAFQDDGVQVEVEHPPPSPVVDFDAANGEAEPSGLRQRLDRGEFVVSIQVDPPKGTHAERILEACRIFRDSGLVHCADVNSNPMARLHMDALWMSHLIERLGLETIPHYTPRDASLMGIQANLLGAWACGIRNVLVITGDPSVVRGEPGDHDVYQTDSIGLVRSIADLNRGVDCFGNAIGRPPAFTIGVAVNPNHEDLDLEIERFHRKVEAGAHFAMTQVFFEWDCWERFLDRLGGAPPIPILVAIWPLTSYRLALRLHNEVPGIVVPERVLRLLDRAGSRARAEGFALARDMLAAARERAAGVYIIAPFKRPRAALELFDAT